MPKDVALSKAVHDAIDARPKECWRNAILALFAEPVLSQAVYVEGWINYIVPIEHGWLELPDGTIIDPTLVEDDMQYFPAIRYTLDNIQRRIAKHSLNLPLVRFDYGRGGLLCMQYSEAYSKALLATQG